MRSDMNYLDKLIGDIEVHSVEGMRECFSHGIDPNAVYKGEPLINELTSEYLRGPRFRDCVQVFVDFGLNFDDKALLAVLLNDAPILEHLLRDEPAIVHKHYSFRAAFTPLIEATLLHVCAEFNHVSCAKLLVKYGADTNAAAGQDKHGFGGQTPLFHTVNQILNQSADMMHFLLENGADPKYSVTGLIWGRGYDWETFIPAVNPISYSMMGLLPQMHRDEGVIAETVSMLIKAAYGIDYAPPNVPNKYLKS
jgi:hypothetical protein